MDCTRLWGEWEGMREECGDMGSAARVGNVGKGLRDKGKWGKWKWIDRDIGDGMMGEWGERVGIGREWGDEMGGERTYISRVRHYPYQYLYI